MTSPVPLAAFDPPVASAVVTVLRRAGLPASLGGGDAQADEVAVLVPADRRNEALAAMASSMEAIQEELTRTRAGAGSGDTRRRGDSGPAEGARAGSVDDVEDDEHRPLVFERLRALGFLPVLLVPLLVVTLSQTRLPAVYAVAIIVGGGMAILAWRDGRRRRRE